MISPADFDVRAIRAELGLSQAELAVLVGISTRAIQSYEQGWRQPSEMVERVLLLLLIAHRNGERLASGRCWEARGCSPELRRKCVAYMTRQGHLCWFFTGTMCRGRSMPCWDEKLRGCLDCSFMQSMLRPPMERRGSEQLCGTPERTGRSM